MSTQINLYNAKDHLIPLNVPKLRPPIKMQLLPGDNVLDAAEVARARQKLNPGFDSMVRHGWIEILVTEKDSNPDRHAQRQLNLLDDLAKSPEQKTQQEAGEEAGVDEPSSDSQTGEGTVELTALEKLKAQAAKNNQES